MVPVLLSRPHCIHLGIFLFFILAMCPNIMKWVILDMQQSQCFGETLYNHVFSDHHTQICFSSVDFRMLFPDADKTICPLYIASSWSHFLSLAFAWLTMCYASCSRYVPNRMKHTSHAQSTHTISKKPTHRF